MSDCGRFALTVIAFVGSVFSPYYWLAGRRDPEDHVALNVCLYGPGRNRWAMTERGRQALRRDRISIRIGPSRLAWKDGALTIEADEAALPRPPGQWLARPLRGRIVLKPARLFGRGFALDRAGRHVWQPIAPIARIEADFGADLRWSGHGYMDMNHGSEPLEARFRRWDWARGVLGDGSAAMHYRPVETDGGGEALHLRFQADGAISDLPQPEWHGLPVSFWRMRRQGGSDPGSRARLVRTLEDSPFYVRSLVQSRIGGEAVDMVHESFDGRRFASPLVKAMLPFRMPRRAGLRGT